MSFIKNRFQTLQGAPVLASKDSTARRWVTGCPGHALDPRSGPSLLGLLLEDEHGRWNQEGSWVLCLGLLKHCHPRCKACEPRRMRHFLAPLGRRLTPLHGSVWTQPVLAHPEHRCLSPKARAQHCMLTRWLSCNINARLDPKGEPLKIKERWTPWMCFGRGQRKE